MPGAAEVLAWWPLVIDTVGLCLVCCNLFIAFLPENNELSVLMLTEIRPYINGPYIKCNGMMKLCN